MSDPPSVRGGEKLDLRSEQNVARVGALNVGSEELPEAPLGAFGGGEKSAGVAARCAGGVSRAELSTGTTSGNMGGECTPIRVFHKGRPDYVPSSPCDCWPPETGVQAAPKPRFRPLGRRFSVSDELSRTIAFRVRSADELVESRGGAPCRRHEGVTVAGGFRSMPVPQSRP